MGYLGRRCLRGERPRVSERSSTTGLTEAARRAWRDTGLPAGPCPAEETCRPSARRRGRWNRWRPTPHRLPQSAEGQWSFPNRPMSVLLPARPSGRAGFVLCVITKDRQPSPPPTGHRHTYARRTWLVMPRHQSRNRSTAPRLYRNRGDVRRGCLHGSGYKRDRRKVLRMFMSHERSFTCLCTDAVYECPERVIRTRVMRQLDGNYQPAGLDRAAEARLALGIDDAQMCAAPAKQVVVAPPTHTAPSGSTVMVTSPARPSRAPCETR